MEVHMAFQYLTNAALDQAREEYRELLRRSGFGARREIVPVMEALDASQRLRFMLIFARRITLQALWMGSH